MSEENAGVRTENGPASPCRNAFEAWAEAMGISTARWEGGGYAEGATALLWSGWKAGRMWGDANRERANVAV